MLKFLLWLGVQKLQAARVESSMAQIQSFESETETERVGSEIHSRTSQTGTRARYLRASATPTTSGLEDT